MNLKNALFIVALGFSGWSLAASAFVLVDDISEVQVRSELLESSSPIQHPVGSSPFTGVIYALNYYLPFAILCLALLVYIHRTTPVGVGFLLLTAGVLGVAALVTWNAGLRIQEAGLTRLAQSVWWY